MADRQAVAPPHPDVIRMLHGWKHEPAKCEQWAAFRRQHSRWRPNLRGVDLRGAHLDRADLSWSNLADAELSGATLSNARLFQATFDRAVLCGADLSLSNLFEASFFHARLVSANLSGADLRGVDMSNADLSGANLADARITNASLRDADLTNADLRGGVLRNVDLKGARLASASLDGASLGLLDLHSLADVADLAALRHCGSSSIDTHTLKAGKGRIPREFLRACGLEIWEAEMFGLYDLAVQSAGLVDSLYRIYDMREKGPLGGVFISYSHADGKFVDGLHAALRTKEIQVWRDVHDLRAGPLDKQVVDAIRRNDLVLIVLSKASLASDWVVFEIEHGRDREKKERRNILCPIAIDDNWKEEKEYKPYLSQLVRDRVILNFHPDVPIPHEPNASSFRKLVEGMKLFYGQQ